jgi:fatty acid desaturase
MERADDSVHERPGTWARRSRLALAGCFALTGAIALFGRAWPVFATCVVVVGLEAAFELWLRGLQAPRSPS